MSIREYPAVPVPGVAAVVVHQGKVLLIKRGVSPGLASWAFPGGVLKLGETMAACAEREVREETGLEIEAAEPLGALDYLERDAQGDLKYHYAIVYLGGVLHGGTLQAADDAMDAAWFSLEALRSLPITGNTRKILNMTGFTGV